MFNLDCISDDGFLMVMFILFVGTFIVLLIVFVAGEILSGPAIRMMMIEIGLFIYLKYKCNN